MFFFQKGTGFLVWESTVLVWNVHRNFVLNFFWLMVSTCFTYLLFINRRFFTYLLFINHTWDDWLRWRTSPGNQRWHGSQNGGFSSTHKFQQQQGMFGMVTTKQQHSQMRTMVLEYLPTKLGHFWGKCIYIYIIYIYIIYYIYIIGVHIPAPWFASGIVAKSLARLRGSLAVTTVAPTFQASSDSICDPSWAIFWGAHRDGRFVDQMTAHLFYPLVN